MRPAGGRPTGRNLRVTRMSAERLLAALAGSLSAVIPPWPRIALLLAVLLQLSTVALHLPPTPVDIDHLGELAGEHDGSAAHSSSAAGDDHPVPL